MAKAIKQFKIGEYAIGGIIQVLIINDRITIKALDWDTKEELTTQTFVNGEDTRSHIDIYLNDLTSCYYADKVINWIESKMKLV
jgi:hypothetical protein